MSRRIARALVASWAIALAVPAHAEPPADDDPVARELAALYEVVGELEQRIFELEAERVRAAAPVSAAADNRKRWRLSANLELAWLDGARDAFEGDAGVRVQDARVFLLGDLARDVRVGRYDLVRDAGVVLEANLIRLGVDRYRIGEAYVDLRGLLGRDWLNVQLGRFQIPFGEYYLRFSSGRGQEPFFADTASPPWFWDEGVKLWGEFGEGRLGYVLAFSDGADGANRAGDGLGQVTLKLSAEPWPWLRLSASYLRSGRLGNGSSGAQSAIWWGESLATGFGAWSGVANYDHGIAIADGPGELEHVDTLGGDVVLRPWPGVQLWLSAGRAGIDSKGAGVYDRDLRYWLAELLVEGRTLTPSLAPLQIALRAHGLGTYDRERGYLLDTRHGSTLGYNARSLESYALALNWRLSDALSLRSELARRDLDVVRGVPASLRDSVDELGYFGVGAAVRF